MVERLSDKIVRNSLYNIIGRLWGIIVALILTPYIIRHIGIDRFGVWAIVGVLTGYFGLLDFGISSSFVKYISEFYARKDYEKINQVVNTGFIFYSIFAVLIIALGFLVINSLLHFFNIPLELHNEARFVFLLGIIIFGVSNAVGSFGAVQSGLQRMDISNKVGIAFSVPQIIGTIYFLEAGYGLPGLMVNNAIILGLSSIVNLIIAFKILPELRFNPLLFTGKEMFKKLFGFGYKLQITKISSMVSFHIDKLLITYFLSIDLLTFYQLGSSIIAYAISVPLLLTTSLLPAFSEIDAKGEREKLIDGYLRGTKYLSLITFPLFTFLIIAASHIMMLWMGAGYEKSAWVIQILAIGWLFNILIGGVGTLVGQAIGKPQIQMRGALINIILNTTMSIILIINFGFMGVVLGTSISVFLGAGYFVKELHKELKLPLLNFLKKMVLNPMITCVFIGLPVWGISPCLQRFLISSNRITSLIIFLTQAILFFGLYIITLRYRKPFDKIDLALIKGKIPLVENLLQSFCVR